MAHTHLPPPSWTTTPQSRHGPFKGHLSDVRPRAQEYARAHNGLYGPSGSHLWVGSRPLLYSALAASRHPRAPLTQRHMVLLGPDAPDLTSCVNLVFLRPCPPLRKDRLYCFFVIFAVQNCARNLKNALSACYSITSQVGISNQRASRSREHIPLPATPVPRSYLIRLLPLNVADITPSWANFSDAAMTTRMVHRDFTLQNKVCVLLCVCVCDYPPHSHPSPPSPFSVSLLPQVSHHPPVSAFYYVSPANKVAVVGELRPKSKFLGNSVSTVMEGHSRISLLGRPEDSGK